MQYRTLGKSGIKISALAFGAGPISTLMVGQDSLRQRQVVARVERASTGSIRPPHTGKASRSGTSAAS